ncbi:hypothetical protein BDF22DRAFT_671537, partial [Syncephalis plumigaleata]
VWMYAWRQQVGVCVVMVVVVVVVQGIHVSSSRSAFSFPICLSLTFLEPCIVHYKRTLRVRRSSSSSFQPPWLPS